MGLKIAIKLKKPLFWCAQNLRMCEFHDYRIDGIDDELLNVFLEQATYEELVNKRSTTWRTLTDHEKTNLTNQLIIANPTLLKRPIVQIEGKLHIGYFPEKWS